LSDKYFASLPAYDLIDELVLRKERYYRYLHETGRTELLRKVYNFTNKSAFKRGSLSRSGNLGQYVNINVNHFRNLIDHRKSLLVNQRPAYDPKAINTDYKSMAQTTIASGLLDYYSRVEKLERYQAETADLAIRYGEGFLYGGWNPSGGKEYGRHPETGAIIYEGDLEFGSYSTFDVIRDIHYRKANCDEWILLRKRANKFEIASQAGLSEETKEEVIQESYSEFQGFLTDFVIRRFYDSPTNELINKWCFYHKPTPAMPQGRILEFTEGGILLFDGPLPYRSLPVIRMSAGEMEDYIYGYSNTFDLVPLQEAIDKLYSVALTNNATFGVQNIAMPRGAGLTVSRLAGGLNLVEFDPKAGKPEPLQLTATPVELYNLIAVLEQKMETLSGINSAARGEPESNLRSANSVALVQTMAIQFAQALQLSYVQMLEDSATMVIQNLQDYASTPRVALISGKNNSTYLQTFKGEDLADIHRVVVDMGNPVMKTLAGRTDAANSLLQYNQVNAMQYLEVYKTGNLEVMTEGPHAQMMGIRKENEMLMAGKKPRALSIDNHELHILEHSTVTSDPEIRENVAILSPTLEHIAEHQALLAQQQPPMQMSPEQNKQKPSQSEGNPAMSSGPGAIQPPSTAPKE